MKPVIIIAITFVLLFVPTTLFADNSKVTISTASGSGAPGCEETTEGCFIPKEATVDVGGKVIFSNTDTAAHTFTSRTAANGASGLFDSGLLVTGKSFEFTFNKSGTYDYYCMVHPWMNGIVHVGNYSVTSSESGETVITVKMNGPSIFYLDSPSKIILATVEIQNYNPSDGHYFMKVTYLPTNKILKDFEIFPKNSGNNLMSVQIAYPILESDIEVEDQKLFGEYEIYIWTESGSHTASVNFSILESQEESISSKTVTGDIKSSNTVLEDTKPTCETLEADRKELQKKYGVGLEGELRIEVLGQIKEITYKIKEMCTEPEPYCGKNSVFIKDVCQEVPQSVRSKAYSQCSDKLDNYHQEQRNAAITGGGPNYAFNMNNCIDETIKIIMLEPELEPEPVKTADDHYKIICSAPDGYCMQKYGMNNRDSYSECLGTWVPFCRTYEAKQTPVTNSEIICETGTVLIDNVCQQIEEEKEIQIREPVQKTKKSRGWFDDLWDAVILGIMYLVDFNVSSLPTLLDNRIDLDKLQRDLEKKISYAQSEEEVNQIIEDMVRPILADPRMESTCKSIAKEFEEEKTKMENWVSSGKNYKAYPIENAQRLTKELQFCTLAYSEGYIAPKQYTPAQCDELVSKFDEYNKKFYEINKQRLIIENEQGQVASEKYYKTSEWWYVKDLRSEVTGEFHSYCLPKKDECVKTDVDLGNLIQENKDMVKYLEGAHPTFEYKLYLEDYQELGERKSFLCGFINNITHYYETQEKYFGKTVPTE